MNKADRFIHRIIIKAVTDAGLFVFASFMMAFFSSMDPFLFTKDTLSLIRQYLFIPWGAALCVCRIACVQKRTLTVHKETWVLLVLWLWQVVPFAFRFGITARGAGAWHSYGVMFFAIYAWISEMEQAEREKVFDHAVILFAVLGWILGITMLYCAVTVQSFTAEMGNYAYGIYDGKHLVSGHYYNTTGLIALYTALMCLAGLCRSRRAAARVMYAVPAAMMIVVTVLTQSRTCRYALIAALALGAYGALCRLLKGRRMLIRQGAAIVIGAAVLVGGYVGADWLTERALIHYVTVKNEGSTLSLVAPALAEEPDDAEQTGTSTPVKDGKVDISGLKRDGGDATFTGRTKIWKNAIRIWKETPRFMFIGVGPGNSGMLLAKDFWAFENIGGVDAHNACLQFAVDYGMIGLAILAVFACFLVVPALRVFCRDRLTSGYGVMVLMVFAAMLVGLMESDTLNALSLGGTMLFFALAMIAARGREIERSGDKEE